MKADPSRQWRLLDLQAIDTRLDQIRHARATLPQLAQISAAQEQLDRLHSEVINAATALEDVEREVTKCEQEVQLVRDRADRDRRRLDSGQGSAKELQGLQHELESLARRQGTLEDAQLEVMERTETLQTEHDELVSRRNDLAARLASLEQERDDRLAALESEAGQVALGRADIVAGVGDDLAALYERARTAGAGVGAAEIRQRRCGGCRLELNAVDIDRIRSAPQDEVVRCEECSRIMIRTGESGL